MKKYFQLFLVFVVVVLCSACDGDVTRALRHDGFSVGGEFICDAFVGEEAPDKIKYLLPNHIINESGRIYEISLGQKYSNDSNCKVADTGLKVVSLFDNNIFKASDGKYYRINADNNVKAYTEIPNTDSNYLLYDLFLKPENTIKVITADTNNGIFYVLKNDGNVYGMTINKQERNVPPTIVNTVIVYDRNNFGGAITDFNYSGESSTTFVRAGLKVFHMKASNVDECSKFADIQCSYQMVESPVFEEYSDSILAYNGSTVITSYKKVFSIGS